MARLVFIKIKMPGGATGKREVMKRLKWTTASVVAAFSVAGVIAAGTVAAEAAVQTQTAEGGGIVTMPAGDHRQAADSAPNVLLSGPRLSPTPADELQRLKNLPGTSSAATTADEAAIEQTSAAAPRAVLIECEMNPATGFAPSGVHGAVALSNIIEVTNANLMVRRKSDCALVSSMSLKALFGSFSIPSSETLFDPRVVYDRLANRCIVTVESRNSGNTNQFLYVASSRDSSCTTWRVIRFVLSRVSPATLFCKNVASDFYDYPNAGYSNTRLVITSNNFPTSGASYGTLLTINKTALHGTAPVAASCFKPVPANSAPAIVASTTASMFILSTGSGSGTVVGRRRLNIGTTPANDTLTVLSSIDIPNWTAPPDAVQPNGQRLDTLDGRFQSATKQIGTSLWNVHAVNVGGVSRVRLYKMSMSATTPSLVKTLFTASCASANQYTFNPSVDTNSAGAVNAFVTASRTCRGSGAVGRAAHLIFRGPNNAVGGWGFNLIETSAAQFSNDGNGVVCNNTSARSCRWGDYSSTQIDPSSTTSAWGFNQLITTGTISGSGSQFNWRTRAGQVN